MDKIKGYEVKSTLKDQIPPLNPHLFEGEIAYLIRAKVHFPFFWSK